MPRNAEKEDSDSKCQLPKKITDMGVTFTSVGGLVLSKPTRMMTRFSLFLIATNTKGFRRGLVEFYQWLNWKDR